jgi:dienelactone hydrolase
MRVKPVMRDVTIGIDRQRTSGKLLYPDAPGVSNPAVLFVHGWGGGQQRYLAPATRLARLGYVGLTFNLRGHGRTTAQRSRISRADSMADVLAAYDLLRAQEGVDPDRIGAVGSSYGGYLVTLLASRRPLRWLALRVPALYKDEGFDRPKQDLRLDPDFRPFRLRHVGADENLALSSAARFEGDVLIVESEHDTVIPHQVVLNYREAFRRARSLAHVIIPDADHSLSDARCRREYVTTLVNWSRRRLDDMRSRVAMAEARATRRPRKQA